MISKTEAFEKFQEIIGAKSSWALLKKSQFAEHVSTFMAWALRQAQWATERTEQEFWLSTAINRSSISAHAEDREYVPRRPTPSVGVVSVENRGTGRVSLGSFQPFLSDQQLYYAIDEPVVLEPGASGSVGITQIEGATYTFAIDEEKPFFEYLFPAEITSRLYAYTVYLDLGDGYKPWTPSYGFQNIYAGTHAFDEFYSHTDRIGVRFGNGIFGLIPPVGTPVKIEAWLTDGETLLVEGQDLTLVGSLTDFSGAAVDVVATVTTAISGGTSGEDTEELRANLHYWSIYNRKLVWKNDYVYYVRRAFPDISWINVWGEKEAELAYGPNLDFVNKIFVSAHADGWPDADLETAVSDHFAQQTLYNRVVEWVNPERSTFTIVVTGQLARRHVLSDAVASVKAALESAYGPDSMERKPAVFLKDIYRVVADTGFFQDDGAWFEIAVSGKTAPTLLHEMISLDLPASSFAGIGYL